MLYLAPGYSAFVREDDVVQFGVDATRCGLFQTTDAPAVAKAVNDMREPVPRSKARRLLIKAGVAKDTANSVLDDLIDYGVLWPVLDPQPVLVLGSSPLADALREHLPHYNFQVRSSIGGGAALLEAARVGQRMPVLAVDVLDKPVDTANALRKKTVTWIPVSLVDSRGIVGPLHIQGKGPCPMCIHMHRIDADSAWHRVSQQLSQQKPSSDSLLMGAIMAQVRTILQRMYGLPMPPGAQHAALVAGESFTVDFHGHHQQRIVMEHPRCPVCFRPNHEYEAPLDTRVANNL